MSGNGLSYSEQGGEAAPELGQEAATTTTPSIPAAFGLFCSDIKNAWQTFFDADEGGFLLRPTDDRRSTPPS